MRNELVIEGVIGPYWADVSSADVRRQLADKKGDLTVYLNSVGGDVSDGLSIMNQLIRYDGTVTMHVDGLAASIASVVLMAGDEIVMGTGSQIMIHDPWTITMGDEAEHLRAADALKSAKVSLIEAYGRRVSDSESVESAMAAETWFTATEAVEFGLADRIEGGASAKAIVPQGLYKHTPAALLATGEKAEDIERKVWLAKYNANKIAIERAR